MYKVEHNESLGWTIRTEEWCGYKIRFVEYKGEWWAVLKDICDALGLKTFKVSQRLDARLMEKVPILVETDIPDKYLKKDDIPSEDGISYNTFTKTVNMLVVNEIGIYEALFASRKLEARKFRLWTAEVLKKMRGFVGLQGYEVMRMTDKDIQDQIDDILDALFWDDERQEVMISITVAGGDVDQVPFEEYIAERKKGGANG